MAFKTTKELFQVGHIVWTTCKSNSRQAYVTYVWRI